MTNEVHSATNHLPARSMLEYCRFIYKSYAQSCYNPLDPFYESYPGIEWSLISTDARDRLMRTLHNSWKTTPISADLDSAPPHDSSRKFDPLWYQLDKAPNPRSGVLYRDGVTDEYIVFLPHRLDLQVSYAVGFDLAGNKQAPSLVTDTAGLRCCYFQGRTGATQTYPNVGWPSWLGAVLYDPATRECVIVFRGSRSGAGERALYLAKTRSTGSPDWVTDMNIGKARPVELLTAAGEVFTVNFATGFSLAFESCVPSLLAAYKEAVNGSVPRTIQVTGHSLGGALAQCAYFELTVGKRAGAKEPSALRSLVKDCPSLVCYPLSAPGVVSTDPSALVAFANTSRILHYFHQHDLVHGGTSVKPGSVGTELAALFSRTNPHVGSEVALPGLELFPDAHEPLVVWEKLSGKTDDTLFWLKVKLDGLRYNAAGVVIPDGIPARQFTQALAASIGLHSDGGPIAIAKCWADVASPKDLGNFGKYYDQALQLHRMQSSGQVFSEEALGTLQTLHKTLVDERSACMKKGTWKSMRATASAYWNLCIYLALLTRILAKSA